VGDQQSLDGDKFGSSMVLGHERADGGLDERCHGFE
jgi:hypothetical protein